MVPFGGMGMGCEERPSYRTLQVIRRRVYGWAIRVLEQMRV